MWPRLNYTKELTCDRNCPECEYRYMCQSCDHVWVRKVIDDKIANKTDKGGEHT